MTDPTGNALRAAQEDKMATDQEALDIAQRIYAMVGGRADDERRSQKISRIQIAITDGGNGCLSSLYFAQNRSYREMGAVEAFAEVVRLAKAVYADERNDIQDRRAIRMFGDRFDVTTGDSRDGWAARALLSRLT